MSQSHLIQTTGLKKYFSTPKGQLHAVDDINLTIDKRTTLGVVGESGCGKSTLGRVMIRLIPATGGQVFYNEQDLLRLSQSELKEMRKKLQIIFQDPYASLNPRMTVSAIIEEPMIVCGIGTDHKERTERVDYLMKLVGLSSRLRNAYPHELDGGRRQRIGIARALTVNPEFIVCDEPVSSLDVSIQAQILNLLMSLQDTMGLTYMFITHDLSVVRHLSTNIMVMYLGQCVEYTSGPLLFQNPLHPYTKALLSAIPRPSIKPEHRMKSIIIGEVTDPVNPKPGCRFAPRCSYVTKRCSDADVPVVKAEDGHEVKCVLYC
ncbi:MAG: ATP-binding cassette domain-containing protein [Synergistaceae bacterium]|jgi:peptide/nickel transport system ATP-binding protein|nr:ATP-binding cassette domain-containing protein [Synergistaceae bacterium]